MNRKLIFFTTLIIIAILSRTFFKIAPNFEMVTAILLTTGFYVKDSKYKIGILLIIMLISDFILRNTLIFIFTWSGFLIPIILGSYISRQTDGLRNNIIRIIFGGIGANIFFYLWTNLGVVIISDMYPKNLLGLAHSYINGLPFLYNQLISTLIFAPIIFVVAHAALNYHYSKKENIHEFN